MRLYALLLLALYAIAARAATIPDNVAPLVATKTTDVSDDYTPQREEEQEHTNVISDVNNKLRFKPADIPVEVIVENVQPALKTVTVKDDAEEIVRTPIDLNNPGIPQRQEHDSQNPEYYAAELNLVESYKKNVNEAQIMLKQGFKSVSDGIQHMAENNEQVKSVQQSIQQLRDGFVEKINTLSGAIQNYLNNANADDTPSQQQTKANLEQLKIGLNNLKSDFTKGASALANGVESFAFLKAESSGESTSTASEPPNFMVNIQQQFSNWMNSVSLPWSNSASTTPPTNEAAPEGTQSDTGASAAPAPAGGIWSNPFNFLTQLQNNQPQNNQPQNTQPQNDEPIGSFGSGNGIIVHTFNNIWNMFQPTTAQPQQPDQTATASTEPKPDEQTQPETKPETQAAESKPEQAAAQSQQSEGTTVGPIRQILQNNPITKGITNAVQRLQNVNNPEKPREEVKEENKEEDKDKAVVESATVEDALNLQNKGHFNDGHNSGDNINIDSRLKENETVKEIPKEIIPEVQEAQKEEEKEKADEVVDKTE